ncbi:hypothetical protein AMTR_s00024p00036860 [Amborella trichopoda]|uniref:Uncharacterized protein n=1 Tax=Amborella trichopoda TaxID=13333 RepID=W1PSJ0_AMBTC|nr:hypothetical protein AMTR_s00024p00036860 [Amborella trichopoda]
MYMKVTLNGRVMKAMVETGATHNLLSDREADPLSLTLAGDISKMKVVNLVAKFLDDGLGICCAAPWCGGHHGQTVPLHGPCGLHGKGEGVIYVAAKDNVIARPCHLSCGLVDQGDWRRTHGASCNHEALRGVQQSDASRSP